MSFEAGRLPQEHVDVVVHCGDLTQHSKLHEFEETIQLLKNTNAPLKLMIAGNHDFTLDEPVFRKKVAEASRLSGSSLEDEIGKDFGDYGAARQLLQQAQDQGITYINEGSYQFSLDNGARLNVYASPYTPSYGGEWGFQYDGTHNFNIPADTDLVITHGPPLGIMDKPIGQSRIGCPQLFGAVAKAQPRLHCFGHIHDGWGAKLVSWRSRISEPPSHFVDIDNEASLIVESLARLQGPRLEQYNTKKCYAISHCHEDENPLGPGRTLFVNAAVKGDDGLNQLPWLVSIDLEPTALKDTK
jgi:hypothetical protein